MVLQDGQRFQQQIAEIRRVQRLQPLLILAIELASLAEGKAMSFAFGHVVGPKPAVLPAVDQRRQRARRPALLVDVLRLDQLLHQPQLVVGIQDGEIGFQPRQLGMAPQHLGADGMEGAEPLHPLDHAADQRADALLHLARGLVGEGDGQNLPRPGAARGKDMREPRGQHPRLAGARARQHQHRPVDGHHRLALLRVQPCQIRRLAWHDRRGHLVAKHVIQGIGIGRRSHNSSILAGDFARCRAFVLIARAWKGTPRKNSWPPLAFLAFLAVDTLHGLRRDPRRFEKRLDPEFETYRASVLGRFPRLTPWAQSQAS